MYPTNHCRLCHARGPLRQESSCRRIHAATALQGRGRHPVADSCNLHKNRISAGAKGRTSSRESNTHSTVRKAFHGNALQQPDAAARGTRVFSKPQRDGTGPKYYWTDGLTRRGHRAMIILTAKQPALNFLGAKAGGVTTYSFCPWRIRCADSTMCCVKRYPTSHHLRPSEASARMFSDQAHTLFRAACMSIQGGPPISRKGGRSWNVQPEGDVQIMLMQRSR